MLFIKIRLILGRTDLVLGHLCYSFIHKCIQSASIQHGLSQIHNHIIFSTVTICRDLFHQCHSPLEELFWSSRIIFVNLHNVGLVILVRGVNWNLQGKNFVSSSSSSFLIFIPSSTFNSSFKNEIRAGSMVYYTIPGR
jgi:hypothetical protein